MYQTEKNYPYFLSLLVSFFLFLQVSGCYSPKNYLDPAGPKFEGKYASYSTAQKDTIKVVSFNIKYSRKIEQAIRELDSIPAIRNADILLLQEMNEQGSDRIARSLGYNYVYYPATVHPQINSNFGNAVLTRWPILRDKKIILPHSPSLGNTRRIAVAARIVISNRHIIAYSVHTATITLTPEKRMEQADSLLNSIQRNYKHIIIGGDFNTLFDQNIRNLDSLFTRNGFTRASRAVGPTMSRGPFDFTLDHLFTRGFTKVSAGTVPTRASDHQPIWVILVFDKNTSAGELENIKE
jgi:endonuclease/exonuclease/phosphatase family metal-dependent hydrolase